MIIKYSQSKGSQIPRPSVLRLCKLYNLLVEMGDESLFTFSSKDIGDMLGIASHNIRKDISYLLGESGTIGAGYDIKRLKQQLEDRLGFNIKRHTCIIGLDSLGIALLNQRLLFNNNFKIVAGFDSSVNRIETLKTEIHLYPTYEITSVVKSKTIEFAVITEPGPDPDKILERLVDGGVKGIINFSSRNLSTNRKGVVISNIDLIGEFRFLVAMITINNFSRENNS